VSAHLPQTDGTSPAIGPDDHGAGTEGKWWDLRNWWNALSKLVAVGLTAAVTAATSAGVGYVVVKGQSSSHPASRRLIRSPAVSIADRVLWVPGKKGNYVVTAIAKHLRPGQEVWSFNQPITHNVDGGIYPNVGPCDPEPSNQYRCDLGYAGTKKDQLFNIIVAIVTFQDAYNYTAQGTGQENSVVYAGVDQLPYVPGSHTLASEVSTRTN
jgi:hypothetical protein